MCWLGLAARVELRSIVVGERGVIPWRNWVQQVEHSDKLQDYRFLVLFYMELKKKKKKRIRWNNEAKLQVMSCTCFLLKQSCNSDVTIIAFLIFPTRTNNFNVESLRGQAIAKQLRDTVSSVQNQIGRRLFDVCLRLGLPFSVICKVVSDYI